MKKVYTSKAPTPAGHYSQAIVHNGLVYMSGQLPIDAETGDKCLGTVEEQARVVLNNIEIILKAAKSDLSQVIKTTIYITDITLWDKVNVIYGEYFGKHRPARSIVPTKELHYGFQIEMDAIAAVKD